MTHARGSVLSSWLASVLVVVISPAISLVISLVILGSAAAAEPVNPPRNACGCYQDDAGNCYCDKKSKCGCPGECEPKGCEEKRAKQLSKQIDEETKRAKASDDDQRAKANRLEDSEEAKPGAPSTAKVPARTESTTADGGGQCPPCPCSDKNSKKSSKKNRTTP